MREYFATRNPMEAAYDGWDQDTGKPGLGLVGKAIQFWSISNWKSKPSVATAAATFNMKAEDVIAAVEDHPWMYLVGPRDDHSKLLIEHDGE